jgi:hypothetical protein
MKLIADGGPVLWLLIFVSGAAIAVFIERVLHCHREQISKLIPSSFSTASATC